jgi:preprotein translocase subunit Sss1
MYLEPENNRKVITQIKKVLKAGRKPNIRDYLEMAV